MTTDPFERAARREEQEEVRREMRRRWTWGRGWRRSGMATALVVFGIPYVIWGLIRAANFDFGDPTMGQSLLRYFFGRWYVFGVYTGWMLFLIWTWAIARTSGWGR